VPRNVLGTLVGNTLLLLFTRKKLYMFILRAKNTNYELLEFVLSKKFANFKTYLL
jgi:hypothetical protein